VTQWKAGKGLKPLRQLSTISTAAATTTAATKTKVSSTRTTPGTSSSSSTTTKTAASTSSHHRIPKDQTSKADYHLDPSQSAPLSFESWQGAVASATNADGKAPSFHQFTLRFKSFVTRY